MYSARDNEGHLKVCLTLIFKVNCGGQVTNVKHRIYLTRKQEWSCITYTTLDEQGVTISNFAHDFQGYPLRSSEEFKLLLDLWHQILWHRHVDLVYIIYTTKNEEGHKIVSLALTLKVNRRSHVTYFGLFEITDLDLVRIDTKIKSVSCIQPKIRMVI